MQCVSSVLRHRGISGITAIHGASRTYRRQGASRILGDHVQEHAEIPAGWLEFGVWAPSHLAHQGSGPSSFEKLPVGPFASSRASRTGSRALAPRCASPGNSFRSVAVNPGHAAFTLIRVPSSSFANATVIAFSAVFDGTYAAFGIRCGFDGSRCLANDPTSLDTLTIRPAGASRSSGSIACVTAITPDTFVSDTARTSATGATLGRLALSSSSNGVPG